MKFLCDAMLIRLGRWLRAAGYDTAIATNKHSDRELVQRALDENRTMLTRDRKMMEIRHAGECVCLLQGNSLNECVAELATLFDINWLKKPFSRCLECNTELISATQEQIDLIPPTSRALIHEARFCPCCKKVLWEGSHIKRMRNTLQQWQMDR